MRDTRRKRRWLATATWGLLMLLALLAGFVRESPVKKSQRLTQRAELLESVGDYRQALDLAAHAADLDPNNAAAAVIAAHSCDAIGKYSTAVDWCRRVTSGESALQLDATLLRSRLLFRQLFQLSRAEAAYREALLIEPDNAEAMTGLSQLLATCARRREAIPFILKLVQAGVTTDLIIVLSEKSAVISSPDLLKQAQAAAPDDPDPLIGLAWHQAEEGDVEQAIETLERAIQLSPGNVAAQIALGPLLLQRADRRSCQIWLTELPDEANRFPEPWLIRGQLAERSGQTKSAVRCYWEAARIAPELSQATSRIAQLLAHLGQEEAAEKFASAAAEQQELRTHQVRGMSVGGFSTPHDAQELVAAYERCGRLFEACGWSRLALQTFPESSELRQTLARLERTIRALPLVQTVPSANVAASIDLSNYPLPDSHGMTPLGSTPRVSARPSPDSSQRNAITFRDDAVSSGLQFQFFNGAEATPTGKIFELTGGGAGILDFDADSFPDAVLSQGRQWPFTLPDSEHHDRLFQNVSGESFRDVTQNARLSDDLFGQGVAVGDINSDGFADVYVASIGENRLWLNHGDGTFTPCDSINSTAQECWTTSCAIVDLDGDAVPDLIDVNYLAGDDVLERVCPDRAGRNHSCLPVHFDAAANRVLWNSGDGRLTDDSTQSLTAVTPGKGLGVAIWYVEGTARPRILIANDTTPNQLLVATGEQRGSRTFTDSAFSSGIAVNEDGKAEGCMGIAVADLNADGLNEFLVTNFLNESNTLFWQTSFDFFEDRTRDTQLDGPSFDVLGFGTQFLDADLDGQQELFVTNGHVDDLRDAGKPYRMPPQLFRWDGTRFLLDNATSSGAYFQQDWLGRAAARVDWNRDGLNDLLIGHLDDDYALLTNVSPKTGHFISLRLIGCESNRDAIGTTVRVRNGERTQFQQLLAGDGYQCSNERRLIFGIGSSERAQTVEVVWPSGRRQQFHEVIASHSYLLVEGGQLLLAP